MSDHMPHCTPPCMDAPLCTCPPPEVPAWLSILGQWLAGDSGPLDFQGHRIPTRLRVILERAGLPEVARDKQADKTGGAR